MAYAMVIALMLIGFGALGAELIVDIDVNDEVVGRPEPLSEADVAQMVRELHDAGTETLLVRAGYLGILPYRTELSGPMELDEEHARQFPWQRGWTEKDVESYLARNKAWVARYAKSLEAFNPPEAFIREGHKLGMKVVFWLDIFDDGYPGYKSKFIAENPHCQWTAKDGKTYFPGLISYAWPEARAFRVAQATELLDWGADGIHCSTSAHCRHMLNVHEVDFYGYEQPVVDEYKARYGVDIRTAEDFDRENWHSIKGDFMNQLYRELAEVCHARGKEMWVGLQLGDLTQHSSDGYFSTNTVARYRNHWKQLVDEGIADAFILGDYEQVSRPDAPYWQPKNIQREAGEDLYAWAAREYGSYCKGKTKLYLFSEWLPGPRKALDETMAFFAGKTLGHGFDGIDVHEAWNFEAAGGRMDILKRMGDRLDGMDVSDLIE